MFELLTLTTSRLDRWTMPAGRPLDLPGRGTTWLYEAPGPPGAPTVLLIHGLGATAALNWFTSFGPLSERFRVVAFDLPGHGRGIRSRRRFRLADCADDAIAVLDAVGVDRAITVGYSLGGPVAQLVWHRHPERVAALVLCATSRNFGGTARERYFYSAVSAGGLVARMARRIAAPARAGLPVDDDSAREVTARAGADAMPPRDTPEDVMLRQWAIEELRRCQPGVVFQAMSTLGTFSSHEWAARIDVPTAVVVTTEDTFIAPARQLKLARAIPGATVHPVHANHAACVLGHRRFVPALVEACESVASRSADGPTCPPPARRGRTRSRRRSLPDGR